MSIVINQGAEICTPAPVNHFFAFFAPVMRSWTVPSIFFRVASSRSGQKTFKCRAMNSSFVSLLAGSLRNVTFSYFSMAVKAVRCLIHQPHAGSWGL